MYIAADTAYCANIAKTQKLKRALENELICLQKRGIGLFLHGYPSSPHQIAGKCLFPKHNCSYMRDYILDDYGNIRKIDFYKVKTY